MSRPESNKQSKLKRVIYSMVFFIFLAVLVQCVILSVINKVSSEKTSELLLNQVVGFFDKNEETEHELIGSLKDEYILRAQTVAYVLDAKPGLITDKDELLKLADFMGIDEINIFDENGTIYAGTVPEYFGLNFDSGYQMQFFKPMLNNKNLTLCQDVTPNTANNKNMMYSITWCLHGDKMIQAGFEPVRLLEALKNNTKENVIAKIPTYEGVNIYLADTEYGMISASNDKSKIGLMLEDLGISNKPEDLYGNKKQIIHNNGFKAYVYGINYKDYNVIAVYSTRPHFPRFVFSIGLLLVYLLLAAIVIAIMVYKEENLVFKSNTDELTGLLNRRAYEDNIEEYKNTIKEDDYIYVSMDLNGLKLVNDTLGHAAGDEIIIGASDCMKQCLGPYGRVYRIGGDEFAAMIFASREQLAEIKTDFENTIYKWKGKLVAHLSISCGFVFIQDVETRRVNEVAKIADKKMYEAKSDFYKKNGVDRRGQKDAHTALCALYTKILKINITEDTYQIVNMDEVEQTEEKGFSDKISSWLTNFGTSGQVHPEDLNEYLTKTNLDYLREYFKRNKTSISIFYRRKFGNEYKQVVLEMIPANDYSLDNQNLFLYVKKIDN